MANNKHFIPANITVSGKILNGMLEIRRLVEGGALAFAGKVVVEVIGAATHAANTWNATLFVCIPLFLLGIVGIGDDPVSVFVVNVFHWLKQRTVMVYNLNTDAYDVPIADMLLSVSQPTDVFKRGFSKVKDKLGWNGDHDNSVLVEGRDFVFAEEDEARYRENGFIPQYYKDGLQIGSNTDSSFDPLDFE